VDYLGVTVVPLDNQDSSLLVALRQSHPSRDHEQCGGQQNKADLVSHSFAPKHLVSFLPAYAREGTAECFSIASQARNSLPASIRRQ
jgi:hypothetical protein